ncbi:rubrerythrin [bacterium]|nr:rubrerythrin [bacterium]
MSIFGQTKGTEIEKQIAQLAQGEAIGGAMYYALAKVAQEKLGLDDVAKEFIELGNQETNHGAFYAMLNGRYPTDEKTFWQMVRGLSKAEYKGEENVNKLADKLAELGVDKKAVEQVREFAIQEKHHGEVTKAIIDKYAPKEDEKTENKPVYVCKICGFEYSGDIENEGSDYKCPICGMPKTAFELKEGE